MNETSGPLGNEDNPAPFACRAAAGLGLVLATFTLAQVARADTILAAQTTFFSGTESHTLSLDAPSAGTVDVTLTDLVWPDALKSLSFFASSDSTVLTSQQINPMTYQFSLTGAGAFYAHISGVAGTASIPGLPNFGLYGTQVSFTPLASAVPLPSAIWLLAAGISALLGLGVLRRRSANRNGVLVPAPKNVLCAL